MKKLKLIKIYLILTSFLFSLSFDFDNANSLNQSKILNNFNLNPTVSFSLTNSNGISHTNNIISNNINYIVSDRLSFNSNIHLISSNFDKFQNKNNLNVKYDFLVDYKFLDNLKIQIKMTNLNNHNFYSKFK
jgi:hypothetical protein